MVDFTTNAILNLPIGAGARVGLLTFADNAEVYVNLRDHNTKMRVGVILKRLNFCFQSLTIADNTKQIYPVICL